mgnify:CR=1 FL=1
MCKATIIRIREKQGKRYVVPEHHRQHFYQNKHSALIFFGVLCLELILCPKRTMMQPTNKSYGTRVIVQKPCIVELLH